MMQNTHTETLSHGYSSESTQHELFNEYQHDKVLMVFENPCVLMLWTKVAENNFGINHYFTLHLKESSKSDFD